MYLVGIAWHVFTMTGRPLDLGFIGLCQFIPSVALCLVVGQVIDRFDRRRVLRACQALVATGLAVLALTSAAGAISRLALFVGVFLIACVRTFEGPTQQALLSQVAPPHLLPRAVAWSSSTLKLASIVGPATGGALASIGPSVVYATSAALFSISIALLAGLRPRPHRRAGVPLTAADLFAGFSYVRGKPALLGAMSLDAAASLLGGATALFPIVARDVLHLPGAWGLGLLRSSMAAGALATALTLGQRPLQRRIGRVMFTSVALYGVATIAFGLATAPALAVLCLLLIGAADMVGTVVRQSLIQLETPDAMRGRVGAVSFTFLSASNQLGQLESGLAAAWLGPVGAIVAGGVGTVAVVLLWPRLFPALARRDRMHVATVNEILREA
jgi:MFS family permease